MKIQVKPNHYFDESYDTKERFISYWHQITEITKLNPKRILEIGTGNGFTAKYLKEREFNIVTLDIDKKLNPDIVGNDLSIPFKENSFDVVACYEVLEHLTYESFNKALSEIFRVSESYAILSLPDVSIVYRFSIGIQKVGYYFKSLIPCPQFIKAIHKFDGEHYWEIGKAGYPLSKITTDIKSVGFKTSKTYRIFEVPHHRFFILKKIKKNEY